MQRDEAMGEEQLAMLTPEEREDHVRDLYRPLLDTVFDATSTGEYRSNYGVTRDKILTQQLGRHMQDSLHRISTELKGKVWTGFVPNRFPGREGGWEFYAFAMDAPNIRLGDVGRCKIKDFELFGIRQLRPYTWRLGVSLHIQWLDVQPMPRPAAELL